MKISVVGGGPAGLTFALSVKAFQPGWPVRVWERTWPPSSGFGLVLPARTVAELVNRDPEVGAVITDRSISWSAIDIYHRGYVSRSEGHYFYSISRTALLTVLRERCRNLGVMFTDRSTLPDLGQQQDDHLIVIADGKNSDIRSSQADKFCVRLNQGTCRYSWLSVSRPTEVFAFHILTGPYGVVHLHSYPFDDDTTAVVAEMREEVWQRFHASDTREYGQGMPKILRRLIEDTVGPLSGSQPWRSFVSVRAERWSVGRMVLIGDAAHACHFSIGSGTALAMGDGWALAQCLSAEGPSLGVLRYEELRRPAVTATCEAAATSQRWFENIADEVSASPGALARSLLMRSGKVTPGRVRLNQPRPCDGLTGSYII
jgi:anthraniloyl-CoA monooxygenase